MKILIKQNAYELSVFDDSTYRQILKQIQGTWVEVDTSYLFCQQYNTAPIEGVSKTGIRITSKYVDEIDYEEDNTLEYLCRGLNAGIIRCHHISYPEMKFVDFHPVQNRRDYFRGLLNG